MLLEICFEVVLCNVFLCEFEKVVDILLKKNSGEKNTLVFEIRKRYTGMN